MEGTAAAAVTSCADDTGFDTLRHAVLTANPGDTIDLSGLACSPITLLSAITIADDDLTIAGPGASRLTIRTDHSDRIFNHIGAGTLTISNVTIADGKTTEKAYGGCIASKGDIMLRNAVISDCTALGQTYAGGGGAMALGKITAYTSLMSGNLARAEVGVTSVDAVLGGGALAIGAVRLYGSLVTGNGAETADGFAYGGGIATQSFIGKYSTISGNHAAAIVPSPNVGGIGGGVFMDSTSEILGSTLDNNVADIGGAIRISDSPGDTAAIVQTTISSNTGNIAFGAIQSLGDVAFLYSTIAFNSSGALGPAAIGVVAGVSATGTIMADNTPIDIDANNATTIDGAHDLIKFAGANITVPPSTITQDPNLGPLAYNGGTTRTHALLEGSQAIDAGADGAGLDDDQRGPAYARKVGSHADIGAYEFDADHIFGNTFDFGSLFP